MILSFQNGLTWISINIEYEGKHTRINNCILDTGSATTAIDIDLVNFTSKVLCILNDYMESGTVFKKSFLKNAITQ